MSITGIPHLVRATRSDLTDFVYDNLNKFGWKTTFNYTRYKPRQFFTKSLPLSEGNRNEFFKYVDYCYFLSNNFTPQDEAAKYKDNYGLSIYFTTVLYWLLVNFGVVNEKKLTYCQGYFCFKKKDNLVLKPGFRAGMHSWLCCNGSVVDVTIWQQKDSFDFSGGGFDTPVVTGIIPEGLRYFGFEEDRKLVKEYARKFARESGFNFYDWVGFHQRQADILSETLNLDAEPDNEEIAM